MEKKIGISFRQPVHNCVNQLLGLFYSWSKMKAMKENKYKEKMRAQRSVSTRVKLALALTRCRSGSDSESETKRWFADFD